MAKVKICGITNAEDARWAANLGADFIGFNFYPPSPRKVSARNAKEIAAQVPPFLKVVGVFVNEPLESLTKIVRTVPLKAVQLRGDETPDYCANVKSLGVTVIKVLGVQKPLEPADVELYQGVVDYFLFDHKTETVPGGSGETFNWEWLRDIAFVKKPWFLAGGLTPENLAGALKETQAPMVDVCSGVERTPTRKDYEAMKRFLEQAKAAR